MAPVLEAFDLADAIVAVRAEAFTASLKCRRFASQAEAYAAMLEELDGLWLAVKSRRSAPVAFGVRDQAIQVAAVAVRMIVELTGGPSDLDLRT